MLVLVDAALDHHVDLDRSEAGAPRPHRCLPAPRHRKVDVVHCSNTAIVERVQADRDALQPGIPQSCAFCSQQRAIGGQCQFESASIASISISARFSPDQRFAAGDPDLLDALFDKDAREPTDFLEAQQLLRSRNWKSFPNTSFGMQ